MKKNSRVCMVIFLTWCCSLQSMKFIQSITEKRVELEKQIVVLTKTGDDLLLTGAVLNTQLLDEIGRQKKDIVDKKNLLLEPYDFIVEPFKKFEQNIRVNTQLSPTDRKIFTDIVKSKEFQTSYNTLFSELLKQVKMPSLPDVLKTIMNLLNTLESNMENVAKQFEPIVRELYSYVDIEKARQELQLPAQSYSVVNLEFVNKYRDYVAKVYAEKTGGGTFDSKGIYSGLWSARTNFENAVVKLKKLEEFFAGMKLK